MISRLILLIQLLTLSLSNTSLAETYDVFKGGNRLQGAVGDHYIDVIQPIISKRCVTCHSCTAGPCQLNLTSWEGLSRGMAQFNSQLDNGLFTGSIRTRLEDHLPISHYRDIGFHPIVKDLGSVEQNKRHSILYRALSHGEKNYSIPLNQEELRSLGKHQKIETDFQCPVTAEEYDQFEVKYPLFGMPFGCPPLEDRELELLKDWAANGGKGPTASAEQFTKTPLLTSMTKGAADDMVRTMESYLNHNSLARQAVNRYVFEHMWFANIHFESNPGEFYRIVRSRTKFPKPIDLIVTEFVTDAPPSDVTRVYYRLEKLARVIELKKHKLWRVNRETLAELDSMFFSKDWQLSSLPDYPLNPFEWFQHIPIEGRAHFVRRYQKHMYQAVGRGAICHGTDASYVGPDYAWYMIMDPKYDPSVIDPKLGMDSWDDFYTHPRELDKQFIPKSFTGKFQRFFIAFNKTLNKYHPNGIGLDAIWSGDFYYGLRHRTTLEFFSAKENPVPGYTRHKMLNSYASTEQFYYRESPHFRWWGSAGHKAEGFFSAAYVRSMGEDMWTALHSDANARKIEQSWFNTVQGRIFYRWKNHSKKTKGLYPKNKTYKDLSKDYLARVRPLDLSVDRLNNWPLGLEKKITSEIKTIEQWEAGIRAVTGRKASFVQFLPNVVHMRVGGDKLYSLFVQRSHKNDKMGGLELRSRTPKNDVLRASDSVIGPLPHLFIDLALEDASSFLTEMQAIEKLDDWVAFSNKYKIERNDPKFWEFFDWIHQWMSKNMKEEAGILDIRDYDLSDHAYN